MKKYFAIFAVVLMMVFATSAFAGSATATSHDYGAVLADPADVSGGNSNTGFNAGGWAYSNRTGDATAQKLWFIPAVAITTGSNDAQVTRDGYSFQNGQNSAGAGAEANANSSGFELAIAGLKNPITSTSVNVEGYVYQSNGATIDKGGLNNYSYASGGNNSDAYYKGGDKDHGSLLSFSEANGNANTQGSTFVIGTLDPHAQSTVFGITKNSGSANVNCIPETSRVTGSGEMYTATLVTKGDSYAQTQTYGAFSYDNTGVGHVSGSGMTMGGGTSTITPISNGVKVTSSSYSVSTAK